MGLSLDTVLVDGQWIAVWISMLFAVLSFVIGITDSDRRRKRLLRDIQILDGINEFGNPFNLLVLEERIEREFEEISKPKLLGDGSRAFFAFYFFVVLCSAIWAFVSEKYILCLVNVAGAGFNAVAIIVGHIILKRAYDAKKNHMDMQMTRLSEKAKPAIKVIADALKQGLAEDKVADVLDAESRAVSLYIDLFTRSPAEKAYVTQALLFAATELVKEEGKNADAEEKENEEFGTVDTIVPDGKA